MAKTRSTKTARASGKTAEVVVCPRCAMAVGKFPCEVEGCAAPVKTCGCPDRVRRCPEHLEPTLVPVPVSSPISTDLKEKPTVEEPSPKATSTERARSRPKLKKAEPLSTALHLRVDPSDVTAVATLADRLGIERGSLARLALRLGLRVASHDPRELFPPPSETP